MFDYSEADKFNRASVPSNAAVSSPEDEKRVNGSPLKDHADSFRDIRFVGITGTNGKTTTAYLVSQMLFGLGINSAYIGTLGFFYNAKKVRELKNTTPQSPELYGIISEAKALGALVIVMEISSHALYFDRIEGICLDVAAFTNLTEDHLDFHLSMDNYLRTKMLIKDKLKNGGRMIVNMDDPAYRFFITDNTGYVGIGKGDYNIAKYAFRSDSTDMLLEAEGQSYEIRTVLSCKFNLYNYTMALAIVNSLGVEIRDIVKTGENIQPPPGRNESFDFMGGRIVIDYANTPDAVYQILNAYSESKKGRIITVTGCGGERDLIKRSLIGSVVTELSDWAIFTNNDPRAEDPYNILHDITGSLKRGNFEIVLDRAAAVKKGISMMKQNDVVLILGKGHEDYHLIGNARVPYSDREEVLKNIRPFFSVVISAYNIEKYIADCIQSVKAQTYGNYECIIVDDGSDDETGNVIVSAINGDPRFTFLKTHHKGQAHARNAGLEIACGDYVLFIDGDDTLTADCLAGCARSAEECDVLFFGINYQKYSDGILVEEQQARLKEMKFASGSELADWYIVNHELLLYSAANKAYKRSILEKHSIVFDESLSFGEDRKFNYDILQVSGPIRVLPNIYYNYRKINSCSLTSGFRRHYIDEALYLHAIKLQCMLKLSKNTTPSEKDAFRQFDLKCTIRNSVQHIREHSAGLNKDVLAEEYGYLAFRLPVVHFALADADKSKESRILGYERQIRSFESSYAVSSIIRVLDDAVDRSGWKHLRKYWDCQDICSFLKQFGIRKGERQESAISKDANEINALLHDYRMELYLAFNQLGCIRNYNVSWEHYDFILIAGGGNDANRQRTVKAKLMADDLAGRSCPAEMIAALSTYRTISSSEVIITGEYAPGLDKEFDIITECLDNALFRIPGEEIDRIVLLDITHPDPTMSSKIIEFSKKYGSSTVRSYCAPKRETICARADTRDCLEFFFDNTEVPKNSNILLVTSNPYCTSQFTPDIAIEHGVNLDIVGSTPDELCIGPDNINCVKYLNELIKTYSEFEKFRKKYGGVIFAKEKSSAC